MVAVRYAATRPRRTAAAVIVSTPSPSWQPSDVQARQIENPWRSTPGFVASSPLRLWPEIAAALDGWSTQLRFIIGHIARILAAPIVPARMADRIRLRDQADLCVDCARVTAPTLVVTGEPSLDRIVPVASTREYATLIKGAKYVMMDRTGHLGLLTQPERFAQIVGDFVNASRS
jgi:pimeloyl-ACP methyl ester carboxylesterase